LADQLVTPGPFRRSFNPAIAHFRRLYRVLPTKLTYSAFMKRHAYLLSFDTKQPNAMTRLDRSARWQERLNEEMAHTPWGSVLFATTREGLGHIHAILLLPSSEHLSFERHRKRSQRRPTCVHIRPYDARLAERHFRRVAGNTWLDTIGRDIQSV
jgi:hypothetical protein